MNYLHLLGTFCRLRPVLTGGLLGALLSAGANHHLWRQRQEAAGEHAVARRRGEDMLGALADRARIHADVAALREALEQIDRNLVTEEGMEVNLGYFYRLEKTSRVRLSRIDQLGTIPAPAGGPYKSVPVTLQVTGPYRSLLGFLRELETGPRILRVRDFRLERPDEAGDLRLFLTVELLARA